MRVRARVQVGVGVCCWVRVSPPELARWGRQASHPSHVQCGAGWAEIHERDLLEHRAQLVPKLPPPASQREERVVLRPSTVCAVVVVVVVVVLDYYYYYYFVL